MEADHKPEAIRRRLDDRQGAYLPSFVLGGIDGSITTFAIVAGAYGGGLPSLVTIVLGFANLVADGFSMAVGTYSAASSRHSQLARARSVESAHIDVIPDGEREEVRQLLARKGLSGSALDETVAAITGNRQLWVDWMVTEEWGLRISETPPRSEALVTFLSFVGLGFVPLAPYLLPSWSAAQAFTASAILTTCAFACVGLLKGIATETSPVGSAARTIMTGGTACALAYGIGAALRTWMSA